SRRPRKSEPRPRRSRRRSRASGVGRAVFVAPRAARVSECGARANPSGERRRAAQLLYQPSRLGTAGPAHAPAAARARRRPPPVGKASVVMPIPEFSVRGALPAAIALYLVVALVVPPLRLRARAGVWGLVVHREVDPVQRVVAAALAVLVTASVAW